MWSLQFKENEKTNISFIWIKNVNAGKETVETSLQAFNPAVSQFLALD